jgi:hypothetical protein
MYSNNMYSNNMYSNNMYSNNMYSNNMYSNNMYSNNVYSNNMYSNNMYSNNMWYLLLLTGRNLNLKMPFFERIIMAKIQSWPWMLIAAYWIMSTQ